MAGQIRDHRSLEGALGLCLRAGRCVTGAQGCQEAVRRGEALLVLIDPSASESSRDQWEKMCQNYETSYGFLPEEEMLSRLTGKDNRRIAAVTDAGFAQMLGKLLPITKKTHGGA